MLAHASIDELDLNFSKVFCLFLQIVLKPNKYADAVRIQNMFDMTNIFNKFKIQVGLGEWEVLRDKYISNKTPQQIIDEFKLGEVQR